jgi:hypothetical protein
VGSTISIVGRLRPALGLAIVIAVYWVSILVGGGNGARDDGADVVQAIAVRTLRVWLLSPLLTVALVALVGVAAAAAGIALARDRETASPGSRRIDIATLALAAPYLALAAICAFIVALFWIVCSLQSCFSIL